MKLTYKFEQFEVPLLQKNCIQKVIANLVEGDVFDVHIERLALDYRRKGKPHFVCNAIFSMESEPVKKPEKLNRYFGEIAQKLNTKSLIKKHSKNASMPCEVSVAGAGPAGLWAAYSLLLSGHKVNLYEQGKPVEERFRDIRRFLKGGVFLEHSNIFFGEGGAGAFSDGKLNTRSRTEFSQAVLGDLIELGAPEEIAYLSKPHIGTDQLQFLLKRMRKRILELGGKIYFESCLQDISVIDNHLSSICVNKQWQPCEALVLASGHSARNAYDMLCAHGVVLEGKSFAVGARIEHPQNFINELRFGKCVDYKLTGAADYTLTGKNAYSFCVCPGGVVVPCASEPNGVATNGMSYSRRNSPHTNSALVTPYSVDKSDVKGGIAFQRQLEQRAFEAAGKNFSIPKQSASDFLANRNGLWDIMPSDVCKSLEAALHEFENKMPGFIENGLLMAPETRTSSPLRIVRKENGESVSVGGIYPIGEGAGYAGGILTSAADGIKLSVEQK
ncbi:MAG: hypothetical protein LBH25_11740 [Fibromonadaceae bacterium]|nr:hypothetical protein [Fibromonadaceae bacterium]